MQHQSSVQVSHAAVMRRIKDRLQAVAAVLPRGSRAVFLDYPVYLNIGDLLIHHGTDVFLKEQGVDVLWQRHVARFYTFRGMNWDDMTPVQSAWDDLRNLPKDVALVFQGGGNTGDIYHQHQRFREDAIRAFPDRRIVLCPQSIHFNHEAGLDRFRTVLDGHPDLAVFVRDQASKDMLSGLKREAELAPDMAHALWGTRYPETGVPLGRGELRQTRRDVESVNDQASAFDWDQIATPDDPLFKTVRRFVGPRMPLVPDDIRLAVWKRYRSYVIGRAEAVFARHARIATDRLHGTILALLMSREVVAMDNSYGKVQRYVQAWAEDTPLLERFGAKPLPADAMLANTGASPNPSPGLATRPLGSTA